MRRVRRAIDDLLIQTHRSRLLSVALEHRLMHAETFAYLLHDLSLMQKRIPSVAPHPIRVRLLFVRSLKFPPEQSTLGRRREHPHGQYQFGWDNEFDGHEVSVSAFAMSKYKVTNGEYLAFVRAGATPPHFWTWHEGQWCWRGMSKEVPLPLNWPVYVTLKRRAPLQPGPEKNCPPKRNFIGPRTGR